MTTPHLSGPAVVGKFYMVPCVRLLANNENSWYGFNGKHLSADRHGWVPVIGPEHHDREIINFKAMHFHVDARFLSERIVERHDSPLRNGPALANVMTYPVSTWSDGFGNTPLAFERAARRMQCKREMPDFPSAGHSPLWVNFEQQHATCKLKPGNICPHRGIDLTPFIKEDGTVICPGHGLRWDTKTGAPLPHHVKAA